MTTIDAELGPYAAQIRREAAAELGRYLSESALIGPGLAADVASLLLGLTHDELRALLDAHFIVSDEVRNLLDEAVPSILSRIARAASAVPIASSNVRGAIDWPATVSSRSAKGWSPLIFVSAEAAPSVDLPANRALKSALLFIAECASRVTGRSRAEDSGSVGSLMAEASRLGAAASRALRHPALVSVSAPRRTSEHELRAAWSDRNRGYRAVVTAHRLRGTLLDRPTAEKLLVAIESRLFEPTQASRLFEMWVLNKAAAALEVMFGEKRVIGLLPGRRPGAAYRIADSEGVAELYFQRLPRELRHASRYTDLFEAYSLGVSTRMPDIVLRAQRGMKVAHVLIEVKASIDPQYVADGAYKLLGYLEDFRAGIRRAPGLPSGVLVALGGFERVPDVSRAAHNVWLANVSDVEESCLELARGVAAFLAE